MQRIKQYSVLSLCFLFPTFYKVEAQKRVVVVPSRTVVVAKVPRKEVVYIKPMPTASPVIVTSLPPSSVSIVYGHNNYWFHEGVYYVIKPNGYMVSKPPVGAIIPVVPLSAVSVTFNTVLFYYVDGVFYRQAPNGFKIISPPIGAKVSKLPNEAVKIFVAGEIYYEKYNVLYKKIETNQGFSFLVAGYLHG